MIGQQLHSEVVEPVSLSLEADNWTQTGAVNGMSDIYHNTDMSDFEAPLQSMPAQEIPDGRKRKVLLAAALGLVVAVFAFALYFMGDEGNHSSADGESFWSFLSLPAFVTDFFKEDPVFEPVVPAAEPVAVEPVKTEVYLEYQSANPYWAIPNPIIRLPAAYHGAMTPNDEELWRQGMDHQYVYQHYKTVMDITEKRLSGSHQILWDIYTSQDRTRKFWTRMRAAAALADFGYELPLATLEAVIAGQRSEMMANYFKRFVKSPKPGDVYLAKQLLKVADARTRAVALQILAGQQDRLSKLHVIAAMLDPDPRIARWAQQSPAVKELAPEERNLILGVIQGEKPISHEVSLQEARELANQPGPSLSSDKGEAKAGPDVEATEQLTGGMPLAQRQTAQPMVDQGGQTNRELEMLDSYQPGQQEVEFYQADQADQGDVSKFQKDDAGDLNEELDELDLDEMTSFDLTGH